MSRLRDWTLPAASAALVIAVAISVVLLLNAAEDQGISALRNAKHAQVEATANSFNARVASQLAAVSGLGNAEWQLTPGSRADQKVLDTYDVDPNAKSGFFLVDSNDTVTSGVLLREGKVGDKFAPKQWASITQRLATAPSIILPVTHTGLTTELPSYALVVAIRGASATSVRGALVFESALTADSAFETEIAQLADPSSSSSAWFFVDSDATVIATTRSTGLGDPVENRRYLALRPGPNDVGDLFVVTADVPSVGWTVVFRENRDQFENAVSGPLQHAGLVVVLLLLAVGLTLVIVLVRRLRMAREQEARLRELNRSQAEFISVVSHELRTPVAGVLGFLQTTVDHWDRLADEERLATVRRAVTNARRLQAMTRDVLDTESIESGRLGYNFQTLDLGAELRTAIEASENIDAAHQVSLALPDAAITVDADPDRIQQVIANLLENARKNSPISEPIGVTAEIVDGTTARVSVIDHGPGIAADSLERVFGKFVRGNDNAVTGTGLGLYIVRTIVEAHQGRVWCESTPGQRTAFVVELPLVTVSTTSTPPVAVSAT